MIFSSTCNIHAGAYLEPTVTSMMEFFAKIVYGFQ